MFCTNLLCPMSLLQGQQIWSLPGPVKATHLLASKVQRQRCCRWLNSHLVLVSSQLLSNDFPYVLQNGSCVLYQHWAMLGSGHAGNSLTDLGSQDSQSSPWLTAARTIIRLHRTERIAGLLTRAEPLIQVACDKDRT